MDKIKTTTVEEIEEQLKALETREKAFKKMAEIFYFALIIALIMVCFLSSKYSNGAKIFLMLGAAALIAFLIFAVKMLRIRKRAQNLSEAKFELEIFGIKQEVAREVLDELHIKQIYN